jgi:hypothetical protein
MAATKRKREAVLLNGYRVMTFKKVWLALEGKPFKLPISVVQVKPDVFDVGHGETFNRNLHYSAACQTIGTAVMHELERDGLIKNSVGETP